MPSSKPVITMVVEPKFLDRIEDFRFENRFQTRTAAVLWLLEWALEQNPRPEKRPQDTARA